MAGNIGTAGDSVSRRLLSVLDCFELSRPVLSLTEIAAGATLPRSTARRLIVELVAWGGLERLPNGKYRIGMRLCRIGSFAPRQRDLREVALPYLRDLYAVVLENVQLVVLDGLDALCVEQVSGPEAGVAATTEVGGRLPLHASGVGKVLLAYSPPRLLTDTVAAGLIRYTPHTIVQSGRLAATRQLIREHGLAYSSEELAVGVVSVAAPVLTPDRRLIGALGIVARHGTRLDQMASAVRTAALGVSRSC